MKCSAWLVLTFLSLGLAGVGLAQEAEKPKADSPTPQREPLRDGGDRETPREGREGRRNGEFPDGFGRGGREGFPGRLLARLPVMMALDANQDGEISASEIDLAVVALKKLDKNRDGKLTQEELVPSFEGMGPGGFGAGPGGPAGFGGGPGFGPPGFGGAGAGGLGLGGGSPEEMAKRLMDNDGDNDGYLSEAELPERLRPLFGRADSNSDKKISRDEIAALLSRQIEAMGRGGQRRFGEGDKGPAEGREGRPNRPRPEADKPEADK